MKSEITAAQTVDDSLEKWLICVDPITHMFYTVNTITN